MRLTIKLKNIGILKQAEFSLGDLTLICGGNNTGKTYAACALFGFLESWRKFIRSPIGNARIQQTQTEEVKIDPAQYTDGMLTEACKKYTEQLDKIFAASEGTFQKSEFHLMTDDSFSGSLPKPYKTREQNQWDTQTKQQLISIGIHSQKKKSANLTTKVISSSGMC